MPNVAGRALLNHKPIALAITGASGAQYGLRLLECLVKAGYPVYLMLSKPALVVLAMETDHPVSARPADAAQYFSELYGAKEGQIKAYGPNEWTSPMASGSAVAEAMVVCPCTTATVSAIAQGASRSLIERAADVTIKEQKKLVLVVRETPLSAIHLENMLKLARLGVVTMPAAPGFYNKPETLDEIIDFMVGKVLDQLSIPNDLSKRWGCSPTE